jgi:uncharacterized membrane protein (DUF4010 family)
MAPVLATAILIACATMFPRMLLVAFAINPVLLQALLWPALVMASVAYASAGWLWCVQPRGGGDAQLPLDNPLELKAAVTFGALLAIVMLVARALEHWFGNDWILLLAAVSGITDVDAINLTLSRMSRDGLSVTLAASGIVIAAAVNSLVKGIMAIVIAGWRPGLRVALPLAMAGASGVFLAWWPF